MHLYRCVPSDGGGLLLDRLPQGHRLSEICTPTLAHCHAVAGNPVYLMYYEEENMTYVCAVYRDLVATDNVIRDGEYLLLVQVPLAGVNYAHEWVKAMRGALHDRLDELERSLKMEGVDLAVVAERQLAQTVKSIIMILLNVLEVSGIT